MSTTMSKASDGSFSRVEVITSVQRRRRWSTAEKVRLVEEAMQPGMSVSYVARQAGISPSQLFAWKRRMLEGGHAAVQADEDVVGTSRVRDLEKRVRDLERLLGRKTMEAEILKEALDIARPKTYGSPRLQGISFWLFSLRQRIRSRGLMIVPGQDGASARTGPHKTFGIGCHFLGQDLGTPFNCQAIFLVHSQTTSARRSPFRPNLIIPPTASPSDRRDARFAAPPR